MTAHDHSSTTDSDHEGTDPDVPLSLRDLRRQLFRRHDKSDKLGHDRHQLIIDKFAEHEKRIDGHDSDIKQLQGGGVAGKPLWFLAITVGAGVGVHSTAMAALVYLVWRFHS